MVNIGWYMVDKKKWHMHWHAFFLISLTTSHQPLATILRSKTNG